MPASVILHPVLPYSLTLGPGEMPCMNGSSFMLFAFGPPFGSVKYERMIFCSPTSYVHPVSVRVEDGVLFTTFAFIAFSTSAALSNEQAPAASVAGIEQSSSASDEGRRNVVVICSYFLGLHSDQAQHVHVPDDFVARGRALLQSGADAHLARTR